MARLGAATISSDEIVHDLLATAEMTDRLVERWGEDIAPTGAVDRSRVAEIVFADPEELRWLESELHPRVGQKIATWATEARDTLRVAEVPLLFESGMEDAFDATICVVADEDLRRRRAEQEGKSLLDGREGRQLTQEEKAARADHVVRNDGSLEHLERNLADVLDALRGRGNGD
jgi:dephospho-CoA kinase